MGFLSNFLGQKKNDNPNSDFTLYEKVIDLVVVSETLKSELKAELKQAFENPKSFYDDYNEFILSDRGLTYPQDVLLTPKFVLIDIMQDNAEMAEVDWKEEENEIRIYLNEMRMAKNYDFTVTDNDLYEGYDTGEIINLIDEKELKVQGYTIELLDIKSDSYVFTVVPLSNKQDVKKMFDKLK